MYEIANIYISVKNKDYKFTKNNRDICYPISKCTYLGESHRIRTLSVSQKL